MCDCADGWYGKGKGGKERSEFGILGFSVGGCGCGFLGWRIERGVEEGGGSREVSNGESELVGE